MIVKFLYLHDNHSFFICLVECKLSKFTYKKSKAKAIVFVVNVTLKNPFFLKEFRFVTF